MWSGLHLMDTCGNPLRHQTLSSVWLFVVVRMSVTTSAGLTELVIVNKSGLCPIHVFD